MKMVFDSVQLVFETMSSSEEGLGGPKASDQRKEATVVW